MDDRPIRSAAPSAKLEAVIPLLLDLDGTLMDSEAVHRREELRLLAEWGVPMTETELLAYQGCSLQGMLDDFRRLGRADLDLAEFTETLDRRLAPALAAEAVMLPDAAVALDRWRSQRRPMALVTSSRRVLVDAVRDRQPALADIPIVVSVDDVVRPKPDPEPYARAASALGVPAAACWAVEDSESGWRSARAAGARVAMVARPGHPPADGASPDVRLATLADWDPPADPADPLTRP